MPTFVTPPLSERDMRFNLFELLDSEGLTARPRFAEQDRAVYEAVLGLAAEMAKEFHAHYKLSDAIEPQFDGTRVTTLPEIERAIRSFVDAGFMTATLPAEEGGLQLPFSITQGCNAFFQAANVATTSYCFLTVAAGNVLRRFGTPEQKRRFFDPMMAGRYFGTMCLSEPQAGSSLADITTSATPNADGSYSMRGTKMWISGGDHEMAENIVHLVLARRPGAPPGVKGISLFIVPKMRIGLDGSSTERNDVQLVGLNHKMGWRGMTNAALNFGEHGNCQGYLVGETERGLEYMFVMMNEARISVGLGAVMNGYAGFLYSLGYARERIQGRLPGGSKPVAIIEHADVRRMLLAQKSHVEGALALCLYAARLVDDAGTAESADERNAARLLLELLTPVVKAWPSEFCLEANKLAMQVLGGYGYTRDFPVEQLYRDNRLNAIHEGTNGIQAIDLLNRKVRMQQGRALSLLEARITSDIGRALGDENCSALAEALKGKLTAIMAAIHASQCVADENPRLYLANASVFCDLFGHLLIGWMWLRQSMTASAALRKGDVASDDIAFYRGKLAAARYFHGYELNRIDNWLAIFSRMESASLDTDPDWL